MVIRICSCLFSLLVLISSPVSADAADSIAELELLIAETVKNIKTMSVDFEQKIQMKQDATLEAHGTMSFLLPDKMRMVFSSQMMGQELTNTVINDGTTLWTESRMGENFVQVYRIDQAVFEKIPHISQFSNVQNRNMSFDQLFNSLESLKVHYELQWEGLIKEGDQEYYELKAQLTEDGEKKFESFGPSAAAAAVMGARQRLLYNTDTGLLHKMVMMNESGMKTMEFTFSDHQLNPSLQPELFSYEIPEGARVVDMTPLMEQMYTAVDKVEGRDSEEPEGIDR